MNDIENCNDDNTGQMKGKKVTRLYTGRKLCGIRNLTQLMLKYLLQVKLIVLNSTKKQCYQVDNMWVEMWTTYIYIYCG